MERLRAVMLILLLFACGGAPAPTAAQVVERFKAAGLEAENPHAPQFQEGSPFPRTFTDGVSFDLPSLGKDSNDKARTGAIFLCDTKKNCDGIYAYLDAFKAFLGPYYYQSDGGRAVLSLSKEMRPDVAAKYEAIVKALP